VSKSTVINRELGDPKDFHIVRRPNEGRKPIFAFLEETAAGSDTYAAQTRQQTPPPTVQKISLIAKPLEKYEQKLLADLRSETEAAEAEAIASARRRKDRRTDSPAAMNSEEAVVEHQPRVKKSGKKKVPKAAVVEDIRVAAEAEERWRRALAEEEAAAARGPKGRLVTR